MNRSTFVTGGAGTGKTFVGKERFQLLVRMHNNIMQYDPSKPIGLIAAYTGNAAFNIGGVTLHSAFYMPFNKTNFLSLNNEKLDTLSKHYQDNYVL